MLAATALVDLPTNDLELLRPYLCVFHRRSFPLDPVPNIPLIDDPREKVAWFALNALERLRHAAVREAAVHITADGPLRECALDLLQRNWEPGDELIADELLRRAVRAETVHTAGWGVRDVVEAHSLQALAQPSSSGTSARHARCAARLS